ncbi:hypothetical protein [Krasilnikovia sp. M28-CT-15]|uniref:hypothetical protein n=1 Tax=Krasilnikovia sp. M28-CT-15 TaxID=3373540 RepID=UPI0038772453
MRLKFARHAMAAAVGVALVTVTSASPAFAAGGCNTSNPTISVCVNHGDSGLNTRGDFYINRTPDSSIYKYKEVLVVNGSERGSKTGRITQTGRHCCLYLNLQTLPVSTKSVKTRVYVYTRSGALHMTVDSPTISVRN